MMESSLWYVVVESIVKLSPVITCEIENLLNELVNLAEDIFKKNVKNDN